MILWRGYGFIIILIPFVAALLTDFLFRNSAINGVGTVVGSILVWFIGYHLNVKKGKVVLDKKSGGEVVSNNHHRLFWIDIQYWAIPMIIIGLGVVLEDGFNINNSDIMINIAAFSIVAIFIYSNIGYYKNIFKRGIIDTTDSTNVNISTSGDVDKGGDHKLIKNNSSDEIGENKTYYRELKNGDINLDNLEPTDHSKYMPK